MTDYNTLKITEATAEQIVLDNYDIVGQASQLPGEIDFNFRIKVHGGDGYILKISRPDAQAEYLEFQQQLLLYVEKKAKNVVSPLAIKDVKGNCLTSIDDEKGNQRQVRLLTWVPGRLWSDVNPQLPELRQSLGEECGKLTQALQGFDHAQAHRTFEWDIAQSLWTKNHLKLFATEEKEILAFFQTLFEENQQTYSNLRKAVVHNDANDNNIIVSKDPIHPSVIAAIDYGDAIYTQIINDLAVSCAYSVMGQNDPLNAALPVVKGYHDRFPIMPAELAHLYTAIAMRLVISVTKSAINKLEEPDNRYLLISEKPAWEVLRNWRHVNADFAHYCFRQMCDYPAHPNLLKWEKWAKKTKFDLSGLFPSMNRKSAQHLDLSVSSSWIGHQEEFNDLDYFQFKIERLQAQYPDRILAGGYLEPRSLYTSDAYGKIGNSGHESRTIHLGIDYWLPKQTPVHALLEGEIIIAINDAGDKEYGGLIVLKHELDDFHLRTFERSQRGRQKEGAAINERGLYRLSWFLS